MYSCRYRKHVPYHPVLAEQSQQISQILATVEPFFEWIGPIQEPVSITSFEGKTNLIRIQSRQVFIGESITSNREVLSKILAKIWLREVSAGTPFEKPLFEEVMTDFLLYAQSARLFIYRPESSIDLQDTHFAKWPQTIRTLRGYCQSYWKATEDLQLCDNLLSGADGRSAHDKQVTESLASLSLRPLLTQSLIAAYAKLGSEKKLRFLRGLRDMVMASKNSAMPKASETNLASLTRDIEFFVSLFDLKQISASSESSREVADFMKEELKSRGFSPDYEYSSVDNIFILEDAASGYFQDIADAAAWRTDLNTAIESGEQIFFANEMQPIPKNIMGEVRAIRGVWLSCGLPKSNDILKLESKVQKLLIVDVCSKSKTEKLNFHSYMQSGVEAFARVNQSVNFISLHVPSLRLALNHSKQSPVELILSQVWRGMNIQNLAWKNPSFDPKLNAFRMSSQIDAIDIFRVR